VLAALPVFMSCDLTITKQAYSVVRVDNHHVTSAITTETVWVRVRVCACVHKCPRNYNLQFVLGSLHKSAPFHV